MTTPDPKPAILTKEQARAWHDVLPWSPISIEKEMESIATEKTKVVPVRSEAEERERFEAWWRTQVKPDDGWTALERAAASAAWLAAKRDA